MRDATREPVTFVTQSKYFTPAFNAAIFDGPIRIYFAQYQEAQALKLYFNFQERFANARREARGIFKDRERNIFVMLYPSEEIFDLSFGDGEPRPTGLGAEAGAVRLSLAEKGIICESLGRDTVVGVRGPLEDETLEPICAEVEHFI